MKEEMRLQKYISDSGLMSRRAAEAEIEAGRFTVNGVRATIGQKITPGVDKVEYKGKVVKAGKSKKRYVILNKPVGYLTSMSDDRGRPCVSELVEGVGERVYPCGRLDMDSEGLLIMTNDGELANRLTHPGHGFKKLYHVRIRGIVDTELMRQLSEPMEIDGYKIKPVKISLVSQKRDSTIVGFELSEGRNRQIRKMCENVGLEIMSLRRVAIGEITLGTLKAGEWRELSGAQVHYLKNLK